MRGSWLAGLLIASLLAFAGSAGALPADKHLVVEADNGQGCEDPAKNDCYRVTEGSLDGFEQGMDVHVMLENVGSAAHNIFVTESANADENNLDTAGGDAINSSATIESGETTNLTFTVPADAEGLYFWCDVDTHEALGMWMETDVAEAEQPAEDNTSASDDGSGNETGTDPDEDESSGDDVGRFLPAPGPLAALVAGLAAAFVARVRS